MTNERKNRDIDKHPKPVQRTPPAGSHDGSELNDPEKAPGTGISPEEDQPEIEGHTGR